MTYTNKTIQIYAKIIAIVLLFFGATIYLNYATDSYWIFAVSFKDPAKDMLTRNGRPIIALIYQIAHLCRLPVKTFYYISSSSALVFLAASVFVLYDLLKKHIENADICILTSFITIANIFIIEYFMFIERCGFILSILFDLLGVHFIDKYIVTRSKKALTLTFLFMSLAFFTYPGTVALFVILGLTVVMLNSTSLKEYVNNTATLLLLYAIPALIYFAVFKLFIKSVRLSSGHSIFYNFAKAGYIAISEFYKTYDILPHGYYAVLFIIVAVLCIKKALSSDDRPLHLIHLSTLIIFSFLFSTASIIQGSGWSVMRIVYPIASVLGAMLIYLLTTKSLTSRQQNTAVCVMLLLLSMQCINFNKVYIDKYRVNFADRLRYDYIGQAIKEYEETSGNTIESIAFYNDSETAAPQYPDLYHTGDLVVSAFSAEWSRMTALNYYLNSNYYTAGCDPKYSEYFSSHDWSTLSKEQLIFDGNTLHLCIY